MTTGAVDRKGEIVEDVIAQVESRLAAEETAVAARFVRRFYAHVAPDDIVGARREDLLGAAISVWKLAEVRRPGTPLVRVYKPGVEKHGWHSRHTIVEVVTDNMRFIFDSVTAYLNAHEAEVRLVIHPIIEVERNADGRLVRLGEGIEGREGTVREAVMHIVVSEQTAEAAETLREGIVRVLADVRAAVEDFPEMRARCEERIGTLHSREDDAQEAHTFLRWLLEDNFNFLGYRRYAFDGESAHVEHGSGLGVLRDELARVFDGMLTGGRRPAELERPDLIRITKTNRRSTVHRPVLMDGIGVKLLDADGHVVGEDLFIGLFTSRAYNTTPVDIPILRRKVTGVLEQAGFHPESYDARTLTHILNTYPRDELYQIATEELRDISLGILHLQERRRIKLFVRLDPFERFVSCLVYVPRDQYDTDFRLLAQRTLEHAFGGEATAFYTRMTDEAHAQLHFIVKTVPGEVPAYDIEEIEARIVDASRSWRDRLERALTEAFDEQHALGYLRRYEGAFPSSYRDHYTAAVAMNDIAHVEDALATGDIALNLYRPLEALEHEVGFKLYASGSEMPLSTVLPMLENMGFRVLREEPFRVRPADRDAPVWIRDFALSAKDGRPVDVATIRDGFHEAFANVWRGDMENDGFNQLVLRASLSASQVRILRTYCKFLLQARIPFSQHYMEETLADNPRLARLLVELFETRFDPSLGDDREERARALIGSIEQAFEQVANLDEDRILRSFLSVIEATLRTNRFQKDGEGRRKTYVAVKIDSRRVPSLPRPRPRYEIFVCSPRLEAVHLRGGKVARGGIRWSDRREDFRTEVLGLMKAQMVKNAVIVPVGSKGGFVVKRPPSDPDALRAEVVACYETMISALLDLTDNLEGTELIRPPDVVRRDDDDPYLVVAADKGTATFSDIANEISARYRFWLDDAFASGGSAGYDHKKMGITARGAWESVKRHFREMGKDIQREPFTAVGVGDMSGDVFGNGMLLSRHTRLVAAFNHLHVFVDPDPDPATSFEERQRLFGLPRSSWADYDPQRISAGGGVWSRAAKSIPVSARMKALFEIEEDHVTPAELIRAILQAPVELLWLGGIGTYVRASDESDAAAGDRANDAVRVEARYLRAQVVGEGANLGLTQRARIEVALRGGRLNTDFIDNSAGVDTSDHEVNIKILLGEAEREGDLTRKQRNELLEEMTEEVAELVLRDNYLQTQSLTVTHQMGAHLSDRLGRFMRRMEREGRLDRRLEFLPDDEELAERTAQGVGLTRPELSVLLCYSKLEIYDGLLATGLPDDPYLAADLGRYFPAPLRARFPERIGRHRLRREILATMVTNQMVNRVGISFVQEVHETTGMPLEEIARAFLVSRVVFGVQDVWRRIESLDNAVPAAVQASMQAECGRLLERATVWFLRHGSHPLDMAGEIETFRPGVEALMGGLDDLLAAEQRSTIQSRADVFEQAGAPRELALRVAPLRNLAPACDIVRLAAQTDLPVQRVGRTYLVVGTKFGFHWMRRAAGSLPSDTAWNKQAVSALTEDLDGLQIALTHRVLSGPGAAEEPEAAIEAWAETRSPMVTRTEQLMAELQSLATPDLAMLAVATRQLKATIG